MAGAVTLKLLGDWKSAVGVPLRDALAVSMDVMGRTGEEACRHALILMAQSAGAITKKAPANRPVLRNQAGAEYIEAYQQGSKKPARIYKFQFETDDPQWKVEGTWQNARKIGNRGLAKRSWLWGLAKLGARSAGRALNGTSRVYAITGETVNGYVKEDRLSYILKALPAGWEADVALRAGNKIMAQAKMKLERLWMARIRRRDRAAGLAIRSLFLRGLA